MLTRLSDQRQRGMVKQQNAKIVEPDPPRPLRTRYIKDNCREFYLLRLKA